MFFLSQGKISQRQILTPSFTTPSLSLELSLPSPHFLLYLVLSLSLSLSLSLFPFGTRKPFSLQIFISLCLCLSSRLVGKEGSGAQFFVTLQFSQKLCKIEKWYQSKTDSCAKGLIWNGLKEVATTEEKKME